MKFVIHNMKNISTKLELINNQSNKVIKDIPNIAYLGEGVLRKKTKKVNLSEGIKIAQKLKKTLLLYRKITGLGRGLAAPQIGISRSVFVTYVGESFFVYINPKINNLSKKQNTYKENCISSLHFWCDVKRAEFLELEYTNEKGKRVIEKYDGFMARLIQHELDHLEGVVNLDKAISGTVDYKFGDPLKEKLR